MCNVSIYMCAFCVPVFQYTKHSGYFGSTLSTYSHLISCKKCLYQRFSFQAKS